MVTDVMIDLHPTAPVRALASIVLGDLSFDAVLERATQVVKQAVPGADEVSITMQNGKPTTVASSGPLAVDVDESQYDAGYGPCLDAIRLGQTILVDDQSSEARIHPPGSRGGHRKLTVSAAGRQRSTSRRIQHLQPGPARVPR
jgi:hypothetical protein